MRTALAQLGHANRASRVGLVRVSFAAPHADCKCRWGSVLTRPQSPGQEKNDNQAGNDAQRKGEHDTSAVSTGTIE